MFTELVHENSLKITIFNELVHESLIAATMLSERLHVKCARDHHVQ
jgi:hypothetical protein